MNCPRKIKLFITFMLGLVYLFLICSTLYASWVSMTLDEMVKKSEVIVVGEILGKSNSKEKTEYITYSEWNVKVHCYLKGALKEEMIQVGTPDRRTSLHYDLNEWGNEVLLFLYHQEGVLIPFTPAAVVPVSIDRKVLKNVKTISGEELAKGITIGDPKVLQEDQQRFLEFIRVSEVTQPVNLSKDTDRGALETKNTLGSYMTLFVWIMVLIVGVSTVSIIVLRVKYKRK